MSGDRRQCDGVAELPGLNPSAVATDRELAEGLSIFLNFRREVYRLVDASSLKLANEPSWGLLHTMYERALAHVEGCFVLFSNNYNSCAEALCRTAIESSINLFYCSLGDTEGRIASYFKNYISTERDQNRNWLAAVYASKSPSAAKGHHRESIAKKEEALRAYERTLVQFYDQISLDYGAMKASWPSLFDRYKLIGKEIDYRTIYSALCSRAHNDAEDLLNRLVAGVVQIEGMRERQERENLSFALLMVLVSAQTLVEGTAMYLAKYSLSANETLMPLWSDIQSVARRVTGRAELRLAKSM